MRTRGVALSVVVLAGVGLAVVKWPHATRATAQLKPLPAGKVERRSFDVTLRVPGVLEAAKTDPIICQVPGTQVAWIADEGTMVRPGEVIARLNSAEVTKRLTDQERQDVDATQRERVGGEDAQRRVQNAKVGLEKAQSDLVLMQSQGKASTERAEAQLKYAEQELKVAEGEHERNKRLEAEHLLPRVQLEQSQDQLRAQQFAVETAQREMDKAKREAAVNEQVKKLDLRKAEMELESAQAGLVQQAGETKRGQAERQVNLEEVRGQVTNTEVKAHAAGMLLLDQAEGFFEGHKFRVGDQVGEGRRIASVIDPGNMVVVCDVGEADIARLRVKQVGLVRIEAIGNAILRGEVTAIDNVSRDRPIWEGGTPKRIFNVKLHLTDRDQRLRPGMTGSVEIAVERAKAELCVPADAVFQVAGKDTVYRRKSDEYEPVTVQVLRRGEMMASVKGPLREGEEVARRQPGADRLVGAKERKR